MHEPALRTEAERLIAAGVNDCEVARRLGVARTTVRDWRKPRYVSRSTANPAGVCLRCWSAATPVVFTPADYTELLGLYLGDGCISPGPRTQHLRISLDLSHPRVVTEAEALLARCFVFNKVGGVVEGGRIDLSVWHRHLGCLLPQHGVGKKHERVLTFESWQRRLIERAPWGLLRGLIRSDGCVFLNRTGPYVYESYEFSNHSQDILDLFCATCGLVGVDYRRQPRCVRICRRGSVALMQTFVGRKG